MYEFQLDMKPNLLTRLKVAREQLHYLHVDIYRHVSARVYVLAS